MNFIGIDPGEDGALVKVILEDERLTWSYATFDDCKDVPHAIENVENSTNSKLTVEYGRCLGHLEARGVPPNKVTPYQWQVGLKPFEFYNDRKKYLFGVAKQLGFDGTKPGADAFLIGCYQIKTALNITWPQFLERYETKAPNPKSKSDS